MILLCSLWLAHQARDTAEGQIPVTDAGNLVQNTLSALNTLQSTINEATMIAHQVQSLVNEARNLAALPATIGGSLTDTIGQYTSILQQAQGLSYQLQTIQGQFQRIYPQHGMRLSTYLQSLPRTAQTTYAALNDAVRTQAALDRLLTERTQLDTALAHSQQAAGALQAQQAATEVQGIMVQQLNGLQAIQAATGRAHATMMSNQLIADMAARQLWEDRLRDIHLRAPRPTLDFEPIDGQRY